MTTALILTIKHLFSAVVLMSLLAVFSRREAGCRSQKLFGLCLGAGATLALLLAVLRRTTAINRGMVNVIVLCALSLVSLAFLASLWVPQRSHRLYVCGNRVAGLLNLPSLLAGILALYALQAVFLMPGDFVLAGQSAFTTDVLFSCAGLLMGLTIITLAAAALVHTAQNAPPAFLSVITSAELLVTLIRSLFNITQFLTARRVIRPGRVLFRAYMTAINHEAYFTYAAAVLALALVLTVIILNRKSFSAALQHLGGFGDSNTSKTSNPAQIRKHRANLRRNRRWNLGAFVTIVFCLFSLTGLAEWNEREVTLSPAEPMTIFDSEVLIPVTRIEDGHLHRFAWNASDGTEIRFIVIKKNASTYGVGFDACDICGNTGYYERKDGVVCRLCDVVMNKSTIGFKGGCNPVPLSYTVRNGNMVVLLDSLEAEKGRFKGVSQK